MIIIILMFICTFYIAHKGMRIYLSINAPVGTDMIAIHNRFSIEYICIILSMVFIMYMIDEYAGIILNATVFAYIYVLIMYGD